MKEGTDSQEDKINKMATIATGHIQNFEKKYRVLNDQLNIIKEGKNKQLDWAEQYRFH